MDFVEMGSKWQKKWEENSVFKLDNKDVSNENKFYCLEMYPYPSGTGLHIGHTFNYSIGDVYARFMRMRGKKVLYPMGYDSFGLPAENSAIKAGIHPIDYNKKTIAHFMVQQKSLGLSYDWSRVIASHNIDYYKWNQFWFLKFYENDLVYRKKSPVNWCSECNTVLANEQVVQGKCWRHDDTDVEVKHLEQWFIRTTKYSEELLNSDSLDWPNQIKSLQKNWIGKSHGVEILFEINGKNYPVFTTRADTIFGVTFLVVSAQHSNLFDFVSPEQKSEVEKFLKRLNSVSEEDIEKLEKEGVFTGSYAINPLTKEKVPVYAGNFVLAEYGSGIVMAVPAHDQRDFDFAKKYGIAIKQVVVPENFSDEIKELNSAFIADGVLINSGEFSGLKNRDAISKIAEFLNSKKLGKKTVNYKLRDWLISRQRYWGTPIPFVICNSCGYVPVPYDQLPIVLPKDVKFGDGNPLLTNSDFVNTTCPKCGGPAKRETDTMDTFFDSSWYFLRFCDPHNEKKPFDKELVNFFLPVDLYIGGVEHACLHLIYARFFTKVLRDLGYLNFDEPFKKLFNQGLIKGADGQKISKSKGNGVDPLDLVSKYGADALRMNILSIATPDKSFAWDNTTIVSTHKFLTKFYSVFSELKFSSPSSSPKFESKLNKSIKLITDDIVNLNFNLALVKIRNLIEAVDESISKSDAEIILKLFSPFCPHLAEELWHEFGNDSFISVESWPIADESKINSMFEKQEALVENLVSDLINIKKIVGEKNNAFLYVIPPELPIVSESISDIEKRTSLSIKVFAVNDNSKYDPENKSKKAKPGKPAIFLE